jgi:molybdopterin molybdotransferase
MAASIGRAYVTVFRKLRVGVFFSGDELVQPGEPLHPGGIYNSNRFMVRSILQLLGCEVTDLGSVPDSLEATKRAFEHAAETSDVILTTGGMSVGEEDHIKPAVEALGRIDLWRVKLKPGKPLAFGEVKDVPFVGLPGNPVSGFVVLLMMARPFLLRRMGLKEVDLTPMKIRADFDWLKAGDREEFVRVRRNAEGGLDIYHTQNSQVLSSCAWADGLVDIPSGAVIHRGDVVHYYPFAQFFA